MKVLHLIGGREIAGSKNHLISLLEKFDREQVLLGVFEKGEIYEEAKKLGINVFAFDQQSRWDVSVIRQIVRLMKKERVDMVHTHGPRANVFGYFLKKIITFIWITTIHSDPRQDFIGRGLLGKFYTKISLFVLGKPDHYFAISERFKYILVGLGVHQDRITTIYNGISFDNQLTTNISRREIGLSSDQFIIVMVARLHPIKGHTYVFKALQELVKLESTIKLLLVGGGPIEQDLIEDVARLNLTNNVTFLGHQNDVHSLYAISDVELLASLSESFPLVILEAARAKTPVISTDVGGVRDLITSNEYGWVIPIKNVEAIVVAVKEAVAMKRNGELTSLGENLYQKASTTYSINHLVDQIDRTYKKLEQSRLATMSSLGKMPF